MRRLGGPRGAGTRTGTRRTGGYGESRRLREEQSAEEEDHMLGRIAGQGCSKEEDQKDWNK